MTKLDEKIVDLDSNVLEFNACVKAQVEALFQRTGRLPCSSSCVQTSLCKLLPR
jgi:hypothetical protein